MKFTWFLLIFYVLFFSQNTYSQKKKDNKKIDSLKIALKQAQDTSLVNVLNDLAKNLSNIDPKEAQSYAQKGLAQAQKIDFKKGEAQALTALGVFALKKREFEQAYNNYYAALKIREGLKDKLGIATIYNNLGNVASAQSDFNQSMQFYLKALKIREETNDEKGILSTLNNLGTVFMNQADEKSDDTLVYKQAITYFKKALHLSQRLGDRKNESVLLNNLGEIYNRLKQYQNAIDYYFKGILIREELKDNVQLPASYNSLGDVFFNINDLEKAIIYQEKAKKMAQKVDNKEMLAESCYGLSRIKIKRNDLNGGITEATEGLAISEQTNFKKGIIEGATILSEIYQLKGDYKQALTLKIKAVELKDSLFNEANSKLLSGLQSSYEIDKKQKEIALKDANIARQNADIARKNIFNYSLIIGLLLLFGLAFILFRGQQREKKAKNAIAEQKEEIQQINEELNTTLKTVESERKKSDALLRNILPDEVADELKTKGYATARKYNKVSVLFTDFHGFTKKVSSMAPEQVIEELNKCFSQFDAIVNKHNLEKIKTIGDAYMCAGGLPIANETNPIDTIKAALEIQTYMELYKQECINKGEDFFQCRLGINTGEVIAGVVGTTKFAYDIWGDTVNTASRAESSGEVGKVNITEATYLLVKDVFECEYRGEVDAKGKGKIKMYFVVAEKQNT